MGWIRRGRLPAELVDAELGQEGRAEAGERFAGAQPGAGKLDLTIEGKAPIAEHEDPVGEDDGLVDVVGDEQDGRAMAGAQLLQECVHLDPGEGVEGAEGLVEQQQLRIADEGSGEGNPLGLAAREGDGPGPVVVGEADLVEGGAALFGGVIGAQAKDHVVEHPAPREQPRFLEHDRPATGYEERALDLGVKAGEAAKEGALPRAAATEEGHELAGPDVELEPVEHDTAAEDAGDVAGDHGAHEPLNPRRQPRKRASRPRTSRSEARLRKP